jgi:hypothetical protein
MNPYRLPQTALGEGAIMRLTRLIIWIALGLGCVGAPLASVVAIAGPAGATTAIHLPPDPCHGPS